MNFLLIQENGFTLLTQGHGKIVWLNPMKQKEFNEKSDQQKEQYVNLLADFFTHSMSSKTTKMSEEE